MKPAARDTKDAPPSPQTRTLELADLEHARRLAGPKEEHLRQVEERLGVRIGARGGQLVIGGTEEQIEAAANLLTQLYELVEKDYPLYPQDIALAANLLAQSPEVRLHDLFFDTVYVTTRNRIIAPRSVNQKRYVDAIRRNDLVLGIGPAGTGKTYLAMAMAVRALTEHEVDRIILCRPAVEAGERLGFLPGDLVEKVNPYLRPLYDALHDMLDHGRARELVDRGTIEVAPLAFMRGRTLNDAFVILDEAQNTTSEQMKMFLTRLGFGAKAVITGDVTQVDLPKERKSGLIEAERLLRDIPDIALCHFTEVDVVRHPLVQRIIEAYDRAGKSPRRPPAGRDRRKRKRG